MCQLDSAQTPKLDISVQKFGGSAMDDVEMPLKRGDTLTQRWPVPEACVHMSCIAA